MQSFQLLITASTQHDGIRMDSLNEGDPSALAQSRSKCCPSSNRPFLKIFKRFRAEVTKGHEITLRGVRSAIDRWALDE